MSSETTPWSAGGEVLLTSRRSFEIMVDVDDVLMPWADEIHRRCHLAGLHDGTKPWKTWHMWEDYGCSKEAWLDVVDAATIDGLYHTPPVPGSVEGIRRLYWEGHGIRVVTARGFMAHAEEIRRWTEEYLEEWAIPHHSLTFAHDKVDAQVELGVHFDFAIDDGVHNYEALDSAGVAVYLQDRPHNQTFDAERRVQSVGDFVDIVLREAS